MQHDGRYELQMAALRGENVKLRGELRSIKRASGFADVFKRYESDLEDARKEILQLRKDNAKLETANDAQVGQSPREGGDGGGGGGGSDGGGDGDGDAGEGEGEAGAADGGADDE